MFDEMMEWWNVYVCDDGCVCFSFLYNLRSSLFVSELL